MAASRSPFKLACLMDTFRLLRAGRLALKPFAAAFRGALAMPMRLPLFACWLACCLTLAMAAPAAAETARVAVASNMLATAQTLATRFAQASGHTVELSAGGSGKLYAQIRQGAPFDALLSADADIPKRLVNEGLAAAGSRFAYATGRLVLWSADAGRVVTGPDALRAPDLRHLAVANPALAPYGAAAQAVLERLGLNDSLAGKKVIGENIGQTYQFVATGNAELGFVALSQITRDGVRTGGAAWLVPADLHPPLRQEAVLLVRGKDNAAARGWLDYLRTPEARALMRDNGYP